MTPRSTVRLVCLGLLPFLSLSPSLAAEVDRPVQFVGRGDVSNLPNFNVQEGFTAEAKDEWGRGVALEGFFRAATPEVTSRMQGVLRASYDPASIYPGNIAPVTLRYVGGNGLGELSMAMGLEYGLDAYILWPPLPPIKADLMRLVTKIDASDLGFYGATQFTPFLLPPDSPALVSDGGDVSIDFGQELDSTTKLAVTLSFIPELGYELRGQSIQTGPDFFTSAQQMILIPIPADVSGTYLLQRVPLQYNAECHSTFNLRVALKLTATVFNVGFSMPLATAGPYPLWTGKKVPFDFSQDTGKWALPVVSPPTPEPQPAVTINAKADPVTASNPVTFAGTAGPAGKVTKVEVSTDRMNWTTAAGTTSWSKAITLQPGTNTVWARALNTETPAKVAETSLTVNYGPYVAPADLKLTVTAPEPGTISRDQSPTFRGAVSSGCTLTKLDLIIDNTGSFSLLPWIVNGQFAHSYGVGSGWHAVRIEAEDSCGRRKRWDGSYYCDNDDPTVEIDPLPNNWLTSDRVELTGRAADDVRVDHLEVYDARNDVSRARGTDRWSATVPVDPRLTNDIRIVAHDSVGRTSTGQTVTVYYDTTPPEVTITSPVEGTRLTTDSVNVSGTASDWQSGGIPCAVVSLERQLNGGPFVAIPNQSPWSTTVTGLQPGENSIVIRATDKAGRQTLDSRKVLHDVSAPTIVSVRPPDGDVVQEASIELTGVAFDDVGLAATTVSLNGGAFVGTDPLAGVAGGWRVPLTLSAGPNAIVVQATDFVGRQTSESLAITLDTREPALSVADVASSTVVTRDQIDVSGTAVDDTGVLYVTVAVNGGDPVAAEVPAGSWQVPGVPLVEGENTITVTALDKAYRTTQQVLAVRRVTAHALALFSSPAGATFTVDPPDLQGAAEGNFFTYEAGQEVQVSVEPLAGYHFSEWTGDATGSANPLPVTMDEDRSLVAELTRTYKLSLASVPKGATFTVDPPDLQGAAEGNSFTYEAGQEVQVSVEPPPGYHLSEWTGDATGSANPLLVTMDEDRSLVAELTRTYKLSLASVPNGAEFTVDPPDLGGKTSGTDFTYESGQIVSVLMAGLEGYRLHQWTGGATGNANPTEVRLSENKSIVARLKRTYRLSLASVPNGAEFTVDPPDLGGKTSGTAFTYESGQIVTVLMGGLEGYRLYKWAGGATGDVNPTTVRLSEDKSVVARLRLDKLRAPASITAAGHPSNPRTVKVVVNRSPADPTACTAYRIYRQRQFADWIAIATLPATGVARYVYLDRGRTTGADYRYAARALDGSNESAMVQTRVTWHDYSATPRAPTSLAVVRLVRDASRARLTIGRSPDDPVGTTHYSVWRRDGPVGTPWTRLRAVLARGLNTYAFRDPGLEAERRYTYRVQAINVGNRGATKTITLPPSASVKAEVARATTVPTSGGAEITFVLSGAADVSALVRNVAGQPVRRLVTDRAAPAGVNRLVWDATSDAGLRVPSGVYLVEITARSASGSSSRALTSVRLDR